MWWVLSRNESDHVENALAADVELARRYALVLEELAEANHLNEALGEPSASVAETLFAAIDIEGARAPRRKRLDRPAPNAELGAGTPQGQAGLNITRCSPRLRGSSAPVGRRALDPGVTTHALLKWVTHARSTAA
jgi:hypothetical protein